MPDRFALLDPWFLLLVPLVAWVCLRRITSGLDAALPSATLAPAQVLPATLRSRFVRAPEFLRAVALILFLLALARPVTREVMPIRSQGIDILLVLDISSSMRANDMDPEGKVTRMTAARERAMEFAAARKTDRIGVVTFALFPDLVCPPTLDLEARAAFLRGIEALQRGSSEDRTAIGIALAKAVTLLESSKAGSRVIVLLSDGANNIAEILPGQAADLARDAGIRVHTIGLGGDQGGRSLFTGAGVMNFQDLELIAETTGGRFFEARSATALRDVYEQIDQLEKVELEDPRYRTTDWFRYPLSAGAITLLLALLAQLLWLRRTP